MAKTGNERLAEALKAASNAAVGNVFNSRSITDKQRTFLVKKGYLKQIIRGWYLLDADLTTEESWRFSAYPWTVIKLKNRTQYLSALESASVGKNVSHFRNL
ncbi:hypothetical protein BB987_14710 [Photorhabdus temperata]|uniref:Cell filamentation protein Fic n=2 Tax=Photorhabdus TaxID=29487 RepID=A0A7X5QPN1_9GAMM|nr:MULTISPECIES: hypothetical protein [Photorhabdus]ETS29598.1 hypothetical protein PTE_04023 [Photorhabdus khanii NC19]NHB98139.1 hypothetical protein [Photorhabdus stackebrandtii]OHV52366.1 hypothetical protein BB987_14710 [Photorhabdus temperata]